MNRADATKIKDIALISVYPPPWGGVSVHAKLLAEELNDRNMLNVLITGGQAQHDDPTYLKRITNIKIFRKKILWHYKIPFTLKLYSKKIKIIHCHEGLSVVPILFIHRFIFRKKIIHTIHNQWIIENYNKLNFITKILINKAFRDKNTHWICVNNNACNQIIKLGAKKEHVSVIPAYMPIKNSTAIESIDLQIGKSIEKFKDNNKLIGVYGFCFCYDTNNVDIYGFNFSIDVFKKLIKTNPSTKLIILIPDATNDLQREFILSRIKNESLSSNVLTIFNNPVKNMKIFWEQLDIYFRPTSADGDSLAIREALSFGVSVVASNVCERPDFTKIFKYNDIDEAAHSLQEELNKKTKNEVYQKDFLPLILNIYKNYEI